MTESDQDSAEISFRLNAIAAAHLAFGDMRRDIEGYRDAIRRSIEITVRHFAGSNFGSIEENQEFARMVMALLEEHHLRAKCTVCGAPAIIRCIKAGNSTTGAFSYDHHLDGGRTFHTGSSSFPEVTLVPKPTRRKNGHNGKHKKPAKAKERRGKKQ